MKFILAVLMLLSAPLSALAAGDIYFQITNNASTYKFMNTSPFPVSPRVLNAAIMTLERPFTQNLVRTQYYQLTITHGIVWNGDKVVQYDYTPVKNDRFRHVIWFTKDKSAIVKFEIYNTSGALMYSAVCMDRYLPVNEPAESYVQNINESNFSFFGFSNYYREDDADKMKMLFTDGLNRFSVFRYRTELSHKPPPQQIVYGTNVYSEELNGMVYTIVGTVPFDVMGSIVKRIDEKLKEKPLMEGK